MDVVYLLRSIYKKNWSTSFYILKLCRKIGQSLEESLPGGNLLRFNNKTIIEFFFSYDVTNHSNLGRGDVTHDARRPSASVDNILTCIILHILLYLIR